ncbi:MAG: RelA/SpoT AH/RIS domain-containing protein, partial [Sphingomonadaceae bacterium]
FAYAVHTNLGDQAVGAKVNGRVVPLRTPIENGDQVEILKSRAQEPQPVWLSFAVTGKARAAIRRFVRNKEEDELIALGRNIYDEIAARLPSKLGAKALADAIKRLKLKDEDALMIAIARQSITDAQLMEALMPGSTSKGAGGTPGQRHAISIHGLRPGVAFDLAQCCRPVPGDRIVGVRRPDEAIEVHIIDCPILAEGQDVDWLDLAWGDGSDGGTARLSVIVRNQPGALAVMAGIFGANEANILNLRMEHRDASFHNFIVDLEVRDLRHLTRILAALRAADAISQAERV